MMRAGTGCPSALELIDILVRVSRLKVTKNCVPPIERGWELLGGRDCEVCHQLSGTRILLTHGRCSVSVCLICVEESEENSSVSYSDSLCLCKMLKKDHSLFYMGDSSVTPHSDVLTIPRSGQN